MKNQDLDYKYNNKEVTSAVEYVNNIVKYNYEEYIRYKMTEEEEEQKEKEAEARGRIEGERKGGIKGKAEVVQKLLTRSTSIEDIMELTSLSREDVEEMIRKSKGELFE